MKTMFAAAAAVIACLLLSACASNTSPEAMTVSAPVAAAPNPALAGALKVGGVSGGQDTNPMWTSQVDDGSFRQALTESLRNAGYLAAAPDAAPYTLDAVLVSLDQPIFGFELDVSSSVTYTLRGRGTEKAWPVTAVGTGHMSDSVVAVARLKFANERAIRANIAKLLDELRGF